MHRELLGDDVDLPESGIHATQFGDTRAGGGPGHRPYFGFERFGGQARFDDVRDH